MISLSEQFIENMFQNNHHAEPLPHQLSLNFSRSSLFTKQEKKETNSHKQALTDYLDIVSLAHRAAEHSNQYIAQSQSKYEQGLNSISHLLSQIHSVIKSSSNQNNMEEEDLLKIKNQLCKKQKDHCQQCLQLKQKLHELEQTMVMNNQSIAQHKTHIQNLINRKQIEEIKETLISQVEINLLNAEITQLNHEVSALRSQKANLQKTFLFNKTKNSEIHLKMELHKSKGLSAAKNSTNSSELMNRNHEQIVFIDPIESDVDEWIKFFQAQKNRYMNMCKKEQSDKMKELGRSLTKQEKSQLHSEGRLFIIFSSIKDVWKNLIKIRENTNIFLNSEINKNFLKQKFMNNNESQHSLNLRQQNERLNVKVTKITKLNGYLICQKQNLQEINESLKAERIKQNVTKNKIQQQLNKGREEMQILNARLIKCEEMYIILRKEFQFKQEQLQLGMSELKKCKKVIQMKKKDEYPQLQCRSKQLQKKCNQLTSELKIKDGQLRCLQLQFKKKKTSQ